MLATKEKSHPGFQLPTAALHPGFGFAISNTSTGLADPLYDFRGGPRSSGYFRDSETGLDYAKNRYHQPGVGRFMSVDPYKNSAGPQDPGSWNRYAYTRGDPVNRVDRTGKNDDSCFNGPCSDQGDDQVCDPGYVWNDITEECDPVEYPAPPQQQVTCQDWGCMPAAYARAMQALSLNQNCLDLFGNANSRANGWNAETVLTDIIYGNHKHGNVTFGALDPAYTAKTTPSGRGIGLFTGKVTITINTYTAAGYLYWNAGNANENAETLLHELAHAYTLLPGSGGFNGTRFISDAQLDSLIQTDCFPLGVNP